MSDLQLLRRGPHTSAEANQLHATAFGSRVYADDECDWVALVERHNLGWCAARSDGDLVGFANVIWDGPVHTWLRDGIVAPTHQRPGIGHRWWNWPADEARRA